jgi:hypothetical protein
MRSAHDIDAQSLPGIVYAQRTDSSPESELAALTNVYRLALDSTKKRGRLLDKSGLEDARKDQDARTKSHCT